MPAQPAWFHRLDGILSELRSLETEYLDRQAVETLFHVRERRARQLMAGLPSLQVGNAVAVRRQALIERLENTAHGDRFQWEISRRARLVESLDTLQKHAAGRRVRVPAAADARDRMVRDLAPGIELRPGELRIRFCGAEDLAAKLFELSQAMANDWCAFTKLVEEGAPRRPQGATDLGYHDASDASVP
jgi:hypothetical protein